MAHHHVEVVRQIVLGEVVIELPYYPAFSVSICFPAWSLPSRYPQTAFAATPTICGLTMGVGAVIVSQVTFPNPAHSRSIQVSRFG